MRTLHSGEFHGTRRARRLDGGLTLAESDYAPGHRLPMHAHEQPFFSLVVRGSFSERLETRARECVPESLVYYGAHEPHAEVFGPDGGTAFNVQLGTEWLADLADRGLNEPERSPSALASDAQWAATQLYLTFLEGASELALEERVVGLLEVLGPKGAGVERAEPDWLGRVRDLVHARYDEVIRVRELADEAGVHPVHLARVFRRRHGCTVAEYQRRLRIQAACRRLAGEESISAIALGTGFSDQAHFSRRFKELTGLTPGHYRTLVAA